MTFREDCTQMKVVTFILLLAAVGLAMAAGSVAADVRFSWDSSPPAENVVSYTVDVDGQQLSVTDTDALCSEFSPPLDCEDGQLHVARVKAVNADGFESVWSPDRPFGLVSVPANVSVQRTE